ncbi:MAG: thioredoxin domain-containing protein [Candidatus Omnitrophica bacterium]|nr:thioredoxin domain-containing protein [Candidatus Omnitrophota bacterium]
MRPKEHPANRLIREKSPYLLQHAHNPVDWFPWGEEAFAKARKEGKPIFLSIGYSTCHWCHVMERESFEDPAVAGIMNDHFVSIKVDREERPDLDGLYMQAVMQMAGQGGWPLSVFLTPDLKPFYGGTYFPPENRWGHPGFKSVLLGIADAWGKKREEILRSGEALTQALQAEELMQGAGSIRLSEEPLQQATRQLASSYDERFGGFEPAPKFPRAHALSLLLRWWRRSKDPQPLQMVEKTLQEMAAGGIRDHLGGGFHRYSTDAQWLLPHFEKMLYDQALLGRAALEAYQATRREQYAATAREIFEYVLRDMTSPEGGFTCAEDADSAEDPARPKEKKEGAFYVWSREELDRLLGAEASQVVSAFYGVEAGGNVAQDPTGEFQGKNILHQTRTVAALARQFKRPEAEIQRLIAEANEKLFEARGKRPRPHLDDKVLVDWNGLMISTLAFGSRVLEEPRYGQAARRAADFILGKLRRPDGRMLHRYREGEAGILGTLEDYAFLIHGLVDLYEATFEPGYLAKAKELTGEMVRLFWDEGKGGFFSTGSDAERLLLRRKELYDGAIPSGNSVAALDLIRVGRLTMDRDLEAKARLLMEGFLGTVLQHPSAYPQFLIALDFALGPSSEVVIAGPAEAPETEAMVRALFQRFIPNKVVAFHPTGKGGAAIEALVPFLKDQPALEGRPTAYLCRNYACSQPSRSPEEFQALLEKQ